MVYLKNFTLLDELQEHDIVCYEEIRRIFNNYYQLIFFIIYSKAKIIKVFLKYKRNDIYRSFIYYLFRI